MTTCEQYWNKRSLIFDEQVGPQYQDAYDKTVALALKYLKPEDRVLDYACGTGHTLVEIAPHVSFVRGIDISIEMVRRAQNKAAAMALDNVLITQTDIFDPSLEEGSFDAITAFNLLHYLEDFDRVCQRLHRLLKPGGLFLSATDCLGEGITRESVRKFVKYHTGKMPFVGFYKMKQLEQMVADAGFTILETENLFPAPPNLFIAAQNGGDSL